MLENTKSVVSLICEVNDVILRQKRGGVHGVAGIVPHFITSNAFIGKSYAKVLHGFLRDSMAKEASMPVDPNKPLYIIELGTGSGKFSFFMLKALEEMQTVCDFPLQKIVYVMTRLYGK